MKHMADMKFHTGIKFRFYPSYRQRRVSDANIGASRFVYNRMVALNNEKYRLSKTAGLCPADRNRLDYVESVLSNLRAFQNAVPFLNGKDIDSLMTANARRNYSRAWKAYRENPSAEVPAFHRKSYDGSYQTNAQYSGGKSNVRFTDRSHITLPKLGRCRVKGSPKRLDELLPRIMSGNVRIGTITVNRDSIGRYYVSLQLGSDTPFFAELPKTGSMRGYDMNLENFLTDSDGNVVDNPRIKRSLQEKLSKAQHKASRRLVRAKKEGRDIYTSANYQESRRKVALLSMHITARRNDFHQVLSKREVESQDFIFVEDLKTKNLLGNHKLAYAISDAGWASFHHMLEYKSAAYGRTFRKVSARYTSQTCSGCGYVLRKDERLTLKDREWTCPSCGAHHDRDNNSAKVVLGRGMASLAL